MRLNNDSYNYRSPKLTLKNCNYTEYSKILCSYIAAAKQLYIIVYNGALLSILRAFHESYTQSKYRARAKAREHNKKNDGKINITFYVSARTHPLNSCP